MNLLVDEAFDGGFSDAEVAGGQTAHVLFREAPAFDVAVDGAKMYVETTTHRTDFQPAFIRHRSPLRIGAVSTCS